MYCKRIYYWFWMEKLSKRSPSAPDEKYRELFKKRYTELTEQLRDSRNNYNFVSDPSAIDALIYAENSLTCQLEVLLKEAKAEGITIQLHERLK